jgi:peptide/nickel transport system permease protein
MNKTLLLGLLITILMLIAAVAGPALAPYDPGYQAKVEFVINDDGTSDLIAPPVPPGKMFPLGTDRNGYDILTQLLYGAKFTILGSLAVALARVVGGGLFGMLLGFVGSEKKSWPIWSVMNGIPLFIVVWFVMLGISFNSPMKPMALTVIMAVVLIIVGVPSVAITVKEKVREIRKRQFVLAAKSLGAGPLRIVASHLFPHLKESFLILFVNEIILTLTLFGQLGLFHIFVGGTIMTFDPVEYYSRTKEWAGLISTAKSGIYVYQWILFIPLGAYAALIIGFYCISKGLEAIYKEKYSKAAHV